MSPPAGRFAPSPTGEVHLGTARTALCAWLSARAHGAHFFMRVEDLDQPRVIAGAEARILDDLRWLGLDWDAGPDRPDAGGPYRQSERLASYAAAMAQLRADGRVFACFCSRAEVQRAASAPHAGDDGPIYPGTCRALDEAGRARRRAETGRAPAWRFAVGDAVVEWHDAVFGPQRDALAGQVGDFVVERADAVFAYQLAVVVDDAAMGVTEVVRGADLLSSTARQLALYHALGARPPDFTHVPLVVGPDGARLAKRHGAIAIAALRARGLSPATVVGRLAASLGLAAADEPLMPRDLIARWQPARLPRTPTVVDPARW